MTYPEDMTWRDDLVIECLRTTKDLEALYRDTLNRLVEIIQSKLSGNAVMVKHRGEVKLGKVVNVAAESYRLVKLQFVTKKNDGSWGTFIYACHLEDIKEVLDA